FGKMTMYSHYDPVARDMILFFLKKFFPDHENLTKPKIPLQYKTDTTGFDSLFTANTFEENHKILFQKVRERGENIPPLVNSYMVISPNMRTFGTAWNEDFGGVEETAILITINDIYQQKKERHINSYKPGVEK
ncbi:MAG: hemolysin, partial [Bacteroidota bacterium]